MTVLPRDIANVTVLSDKLAALPGIDEQTIAEVQALERIALYRSLQVAANGKSPRHWTLERWCIVITMSLTIAGSVFVFGGDWYGTKHDVEAMKADVAAVKVDTNTLKAGQWTHQAKLDVLTREVETIQKSEYSRARLRPTPQFGP